MKLPVIRHLHKNNDTQAMENTIAVLESYTEHSSISDQEMDVIGEMITNLCGAVEVNQMIQDGVDPKKAPGAFAKKVMGSIDL